MTTLYIYNVDTRHIVATIIAGNNLECENKAADLDYDLDRYGWTYSPAFGATDGLIDSVDVEIFE